MCLSAPPRDLDIPETPPKEGEYFINPVWSKLKTSRPQNAFRSAPSQWVPWVPPVKSGSKSMEFPFRGLLLRPRNCASINVRVNFKCIYTTMYTYIYNMRQYVCVYIDDIIDALDVKKPSFAQSRSFLFTVTHRLWRCVSCWSGIFSQLSWFTRMLGSWCFSRRSLTQETWKDECVATCWTVCSLMYDIKNH